MAKWLRRRSCTIWQSQRRHRDLSRGSAKYNTCLVHVVASQWTRVALNSFQEIQWSTWIPRCFSFLWSFPVCEESPQLGVSHPYNWVHKEIRSKVGISNAHKTRNTMTTRKQSQSWHGGYPVVRPSTKLAYSMQQERKATNRQTDYRTGDYWENRANQRL